MGAKTRAKAARGCHFNCGGKMESRMAPSQQPKARQTARGSRIFRVILKGRVGIMRAVRRAKCAPVLRAAREAVICMIIIARRAMKL